MNGQILGILGTLTGIIYIIGIVVISFAALLTAAEIFASITRIITRHRYRKGRKILSSSGYTGAEAARTFLDLNGLQNINVEIVGFWKGLFFGNTYSIKKQTIYLRKNVANQTNLTSIGLALKEVATAINCKNGDKKTIFMTKIKRVLPFVGFLLIPLIVVGLLIDYAVFSFEGTVSIIFALIGIVFFTATFIISLLLVKTEKKANNKAIELMLQTNFLHQDEIAVIDRLFKAMILQYIADVIISAIQIVKLLIQLLGLIFKRKK